MVADSRQMQRGWRGLWGGDSTPSPTPTEGVSVLDDQLADLRRCLYDLTAEVKRLALRSELAELCDAEPQLRSLFRQLLEQEVERELALSVVKGIAAELTRQALGDYHVVRERAVAQLSRRLTCRGPLTVHGSTRVVFVVGPTGVGKTTTVAKLAARMALYERRRVLLVSADNYRIGAEAQLRTYADIIGLPLLAVQSPEELLGAFRDHAQCDLIFVDTAGRSQRNVDGLRETAALIAAVPVEDREVHLAVTAGTRARQLFDVAAAFAQLGPDALLVTKLDEALSFGPLLGLLERCGCPLSYLTTGQAVPEDLEVAQSHRLAEHILRGY